MQIRAITLDLDDTLWPVMPVIEAADRTVYAWLEDNCPQVAERYDIPGLYRLREEVLEAAPELAHDFSAMRRMMLSRAITECGYCESDAQTAYDVFFEARHQVSLFEDVLPALRRLSARYPLAAISNGNADVRRLGLEKYIRFSIHPRDVGRQKPAQEMFDAAASRLGLEPADILHVGDHLEQDVLGALRAGFQALWLNREDRPGVDGVESIGCLNELADRLVPAASE